MKISTNELDFIKLVFELLIKVTFYISKFSKINDELF
jgi:hypothetical protein